MDLSGLNIGRIPAQKAATALTADRNTPRRRKDDVQIPQQNAVIDPSAQGSRDIARGSLVNILA